MNSHLYQWLQKARAARAVWGAIGLAGEQRISALCRSLYREWPEFDKVIRQSGKALVLGRALAIGLAFGCGAASGAELPAATHFRQNVRPILEKYCSDCHLDGMNKGGVAFDEFKSDQALLAKHDLWLAVMKNLRAGLMPPAKKARPTDEERQRLEQWIKYEAFGLDPQNPDPGRVTVRRLNRVEYHNTIRDLMGIEFNSEVEFPPDDTGYGFDNIGDVLTVSPMLLEKYMGAAKTIVSEAVPTVSKVAPERVIAGSRFRPASSEVGRENRDRNRKDSLLSFSYYDATNVSTFFRAEQSGGYHLTLEIAVKGNFESDPGRCRVSFKVDGEELLQTEKGWYDNKIFRFDFDQKWKAGEHPMVFELQPLTPVEKKINSLDMRIVSVTIRGPMEQEHWTRPKNYDRFFTRDDPKTPAARRKYAAEVLDKFASKAFRRPVERETVNRLVAVAEKVWAEPGKTFEAGVAHAIVAVLASPRFLFHLEESESPSSKSGYARVDEYSLASRLSYFLWSTMPDPELVQLAARGELRKNLNAQVKRMLEDSRSEALVQSFTGQWLQTRDVEGIEINSRAVLARDNGEQRDFARRRQRFQELLAIPEEKRTAEQKDELRQMNEQRRRRFGNRQQIELDRDLRQALRAETEMCVAYVLRENRSVLELIESDYTFLNEKLARHYALTNLDVTGTEMKRVTLPSDSARGGVLTHGSVLVVTSNPDRTSPVKRGLFVLDNILGTPAPPPPANVPALEVAEKDFKDHEPTLRETLTLHREKPLCASCHTRMDPIGLAFENFNALGMWRDKERKQTIETSGQLITGESFESVRELKHVLVTKHRLDFYRCLTEKLLTYAVGRGTEYYDAETLDQIVQRLDEDGGRFQALLTGVIESAPFQKMRIRATDVASNAKETLPSARESKRVANRELKKP